MSLVSSFPYTFFLRKLSRAKLRIQGEKRGWEVPSHKVLSCPELSGMEQSCWKAYLVAQLHLQSYFHIAIIQEKKCGLDQKNPFRCPCPTSSRLNIFWPGQFTIYCLWIAIKNRGLFLGNSFWWPCQAIPELTIIWHPTRSITIIYIWIAIKKKMGGFPKKTFRWPCQVNPGIFII